MNSQFSPAGIIGLLGLLGLIALTIFPIPTPAPYIIAGVMFLVGLHLTTDRPELMLRDRDGEESD